MRNVMGQVAAPLLLWAFLDAPGGHARCNICQGRTDFDEIEEFPAESCSTRPGELWPQSYDMDACSVKLQHECTGNCGWSVEAPEYIDAEQGRWVKNRVCIDSYEKEDGANVVLFNLSKSDFASRDAVLDACAAHCARIPLCFFATVNYGTISRWMPDRVHCTMHTKNCVESSVWAKDGNYVYQKTATSFVPIDNEFFMTDDTSCSIDGEGCVTDGEGDYADGATCAFYFIGSGKLVNKEFDLEDTGCSYEFMDVTTNLDSMAAVDTCYDGNDFPATLEVDGFAHFEFYADNNGDTGSGFRICPPGTDSTPPTPPSLTDSITKFSELRAWCNASVDNCKVCKGRNIMKRGEPICKLKFTKTAKCKRFKGMAEMCDKVRGCYVKKSRDGRRTWCKGGRADLGQYE